MGLVSFSNVLNDDSLKEYFSWAGANFPYNAGAQDITIAANTLWGQSAQAMTINVTGTVGTAGNLNLTLTSTGMPGSPLTIAIPVNAADTAPTTAGRIPGAIAGNATANAIFVAYAVGTLVTIISKNAPQHDPAMNAALANGTNTGITAVPTATQITVGSTPEALVGYKKVKKLTINAGVTLTIKESPFYIFADEIVFGDAASTIDISGPNGGVNAVIPYYDTWCARGANGVPYYNGGAGGGMLFIIANKISGANGVIKANGGNGTGTGSSASTQGKGGQGAFSSVIDDNSSAIITNLYLSLHGAPYHIGASTSAIVATSANNYQYTTDKLLGKCDTISGGASGNGSTAVQVGKGGSGIGAGGASYPGNVANALSTAPAVTPSPQDLLILAKMKCLGGGGGGGSYGSTINCGGGGGGGSIVVWSHLFQATPTLQANGGAPTNSSMGNPGGAGQTYSILL